MDQLNLVAIGLVIVFTAIAFYVDLVHGKLPNWLTMPALLVAIVFHSSVGGWAGLQHSLLGALVGFALLLVLFLTGGGGGGDVKFMAALGAWFGPMYILILFVASAVLALMITLGMFVAKFMFRDRPNTSDKLAEAESDSNRKKLDRARQTIPYGVPVCLVCWLFLALRLVLLLKGPVENG